MVNPQAVESRVQQNQSVLNPTDLSMMVQDGKLRPDMTVTDFLQSIGIDPAGPVTQLIQAMHQQSQMASPVDKMRAIAGGQPGGMPQGQPAQSGPPQGGGLRGLLGG